MRHQRQPVKGATADAPLGNICSAFYINKMDNDITLRIRKKLFALCVVLGVKVFNNPTNPAQPATLNIVGNKVHRTKYSRATELTHNIRSSSESSRMIKPRIKRQHEFKAYALLWDSLNG